LINWARLNELTIPGIGATAGRFLEFVSSLIPVNHTITGKEWSVRHRGVLILLWLHALGLTAFGVYRGYGALQSLGAGALISLAALIANRSGLGRSARAAIASIGLMTCSAVLVRFSGGHIEAHFHFFVMVAVIAMYEDWVPYLIAILYVALEHGLMGQFIPTAVYNHPDAFAHPWKWGLIHSALILCMSVAQLAAWRVSMRARARASLVLNSTGEGIVGLDLNGKITFANTAAANMTGYPLDSLIGRDMKQILRDPDDTPPSCSLEPALTSRFGNYCRCVDKEIIRSDGTRLRPVDLGCNIIIEHGVTVGTVVTLKDESYRKQAEDALRENEERLRQMAENIAEVFWMSSPDKTQMIYVSPAYEQIWGRPCKDLYSHPASWMDAIHPEDRERVRRAARDKQISGEYDEEYRIMRTDGSVRWIRDRAFPVRDTKGQIYRIAGVAADITSYKNAEEAIQRTNKTLAELNLNLEERVKARTLELEDVIRQVDNEKQKTERIINEITDGVIMTGPAGNVVLINPAARTHLLGKQTPDTPDDPEDISNNPRLREIFDNPDEPTAREIEVYDPVFLSTRVFMATAVPLKDERGVFLGKVAVFHDITHFKEVDRLKSEFISQVSHELRTPLTAIKGYIDNLRDGLAGVLTEKQINYLDRVTKNTNHLAHLIADLLDISRIESGKMTLNLAPMSMRDLIERVVRGMRASISEKQLEVKLESDAPEHPIYGDHDKLEQVVTNLLDNALKFTPPGGRITITLRQNDHFLTTSVWDTGIGIPLEKQSRVFERFSRIRQDSLAKTGGTGLGLYITKNIIEMHGGRIWLVSEPGRGCEFTFVLPTSSVITVDKAAANN
jgi:PAS domain S-box-containing protein